MAKKQMSRKGGRSSSREEFEDLPSMNTEYSESSSGSGRRSRGGRSQSVAGEREVSEILREFIGSPAVKYVAGGIATALLSRLATKLSDRYPEISTFIRDNLDTVERGFSGYRDSSVDSARH